MQTPIDLAAPRTIVIRQACHAYTFQLRPISSADWTAYFDSIVTTSERQGKDLVRRSDAGAAGVALVESVLIDANGYRMPGREAEITQVADWQTKIPMQHRLAIAEVLLDVRAIDDDAEEALLLGRETVVLESLWSADADGNIRRHAPLVHVFDTPTAEHQRRFLRDASRSRVVGGTRNGRTVWRGAQTTLAALYDELIVSVEGYVYNGSAIGGRSTIAAWMDMRHKVAAAEKLFAPAIAEQEEASE